VHSLSHSLGGANPKLHHGTLNAMFLPAVVRFNAAAESMQRDRRLQRMAHAMGLGSCDSRGTEVAEALREMNARLGLPSGLKAMGVTPELFGRIVDGAMKDHCHKTNPRVATADEYLEILATSM
jgi:alcohol dehydrogenase class IV